MKTDSRSFLILLALLAAPGWSPAWADQTRTYTDPVYLYSVDYPEDWKVRTVSKVTLVTSPRESKDDPFSENVEIVAEDLSRLPENISLIDYYRRAAGSGPKYLEDFKVLEEAQTVWMERDTVANLYTMTDKGVHFKRKSYTFMAGQTAYVLTFTATVDSYDAYLPKAERIMRSIRVSP